MLTAKQSKNRSKKIMKEGVLKAPSTFSGYATVFDALKYVKQPTKKFNFFKKNFIL